MAHGDENEPHSQAAMTVPSTVALRTDDGLGLKRSQTFTFAGKMYEVRAVEFEGEWTVAAYCDGVRASIPFIVQTASGDLVAELMIKAEDDARKRAGKR